MTPGGTGNVVAGAVTFNGTTLSAADSTKITIAEALDVTGALTGTSGSFSTTLGVTGATTLSGGAIVNGSLTAGSLTTNSITSNGSNADISIQPSGTGAVSISAIQVAGTEISSTDSSQVTIKENVRITGTTNTADVTTTGNTTISGALTSGTFNVGDLNITADGTISTDTNGDVNIDPAGTGVVNIASNITHTGTQTTTGQFNVDNLRMDGNVLSATSGGITLTPAAGQNVTVGGTNTNFQAAEIHGTVGEFTTLRTDKLEMDTSDGDMSINTQGTGTLDFNTPTQTTIGSAGGASALPGAPTGYLKVKIAGTLRVIPFWDQA